MKYKFLIVLFFLLSNCQAPKNNFVYESNGFAGNLIDLGIKENSEVFQVALNKKIPSKNIKITNLSNNKSIIISNIIFKKIESEYSIFLNNKAFSDLSLDSNLPYVRIETVKANPKFIAKTAKEFKEEKKVSNVSKVSSVGVISLNSKNKSNLVKNNKNIYLKYGSFYYKSYAVSLKNNLRNILEFNQISVEGKGKSFNVLIGPLKMSQYKQVYNLLKTTNYDSYDIIIK